MIRILHAPIAAGFLLASAAFSTSAEAAIEITPTALSGSEAIVTFAGLQGSGFASVTTQGVTISTAGGSAQLGFGQDNNLGRTGPPEVTSLNNYSAGSEPYPDLNVVFPMQVNRVGMDLRTGPTDALVTFTLLSGGVQVDTIQIAGKLSNGLGYEFYGFETTAVFDSLLLDVPALGAAQFDNVRFENALANGSVPEPTSVAVWASISLIAGISACRTRDSNGAEN